MCLNTLFLAIFMYFMGRAFHQTFFFILNLVFDWFCTIFTEIIALVESLTAFFKYIYTMQGMTLWNVQREWDLCPSFLLGTLPVRYFFYPNGVPVRYLLYPDSISVRYFLYPDGISVNSLFLDVFCHTKHTIRVE